MSVIKPDLNKSSKELYALARTLRNNGCMKSKELESFFPPYYYSSSNNKKLKPNTFSKHPNNFPSVSSTSLGSSKNSYSQTSLLYAFNKIYDKNISKSKHSLLSNNLHLKSPKKSLLSSEDGDDVDSKISLKIETIFHCGNIKKPIHKISEPKINQDEVRLKSCKSLTKPTATKTVEKVEKSHLESCKKKCAPWTKAIDTKLKECLQKTLNCLEEIRKAMSRKVKPPDGVDDWERLRVRTMEFSSRFQRNYLYQLEREMDSLKKMIRHCGNNHGVNNSSHLLSAYHIILQAFQAYLCQMSTMVANTLVLKLKQILEQTVSLCGIHMKCIDLGYFPSTKSENLLGNLSNNCNTLIDKIQEACNNQSNIIPIYNRRRLTLKGYKINTKRILKPNLHKKSTLESRLSMYSVKNCVGKKDVFWKKTIENLARDKLKFNHVQSRYKTAGFKRRPGIEKQIVMELPSKTKIPAKRSSFSIKNTPMLTSHNEDDIVTMVETQEDQKETSNKCDDHDEAIINIQVEALMPFIEQLWREVCPNKQAPTPKQLEKLGKDILEMVLRKKINNIHENKNRSNNNGTMKVVVENVKKILHKLMQSFLNASNKVDINDDLTAPTKNGKCLHVNGVKHFNIEDQLNNTCVEDKIFSIVNTLHNGLKPEVNTVDVGNQIYINSSQDTINNKSKRRQTITSVTGLKNAQLICVRDDDSTIESARELKLGETLTNTQKTTCDQTETQNNSNKPKVLNLDKLFKPNFKLSRISKKNLKQLPVIHKTYLSNIMEYKLQYSEFSKENHMYRELEKLQPWDIVDTISEHLLNELLLHLARELQVEAIIENLYKLEFQ